MDAPAESFTASITCERSQLKAVAGAIISTVLFLRALGTVSPAGQQICGVTFPTLSPNPELDAIVEARVDELYSTAKPGTKGVIAIEFCEEKTRRTWYGKTVEDLPWEEYRLTIEVVSGQSERERAKTEAITKTQLSRFLTSLLVFAESKKTHVPPITSNAVLPFPWRISIS